MSVQVKELIWFNISALYASIAAYFLVRSESSYGRAAAAFFVVHGSLWAIFRALSCHLVDRPAKNGKQSR